MKSQGITGQIKSCPPDIIKIMEVPCMSWQDELNSPCDEKVSILMGL